MSVELNPQEQMLYQMVKSQLGDSCTFEEAEKNISAVKGILNLSEELAQRVIDKFRADLAPPPIANVTPRLLVDWGELPRVGHQVRPEFTCRFVWQVGSIAFWDNRCAQHNPVNDYHGFRRVMHRVTLAGDRPR